MLEDHRNEFGRRDESNAWLAASKVLRWHGICSERHEKTALRFGNLCAESGDFLVSNRSSSALQLDPDHGTLESEFVAMGNYVDPLICAWGRNTCAKAHRPEQIGDEACEGMTLQLRRQLP